jgi:hypothetical protein
MKDQCTLSWINVQAVWTIDRIAEMFIVTGNGTESGQGYDFTTIKYDTYGDHLMDCSSYDHGLNDIAFSNRYLIILGMFMLPGKVMEMELGMTMLL